MNKEINTILSTLDISFNYLENTKTVLVERDIFLDLNKYKSLKESIKILKTKLKSCDFNCLHDNAIDKQRWPLLNLVRQLLKNINYKMKPIRKSDGYTEDKKKKYKRYFLIEKITV